MISPPVPLDALYSREMSTKTFKSNKSRNLSGMKDKSRGWAAIEKQHADKDDSKWV